MKYLIRFFKLVGFALIFSLFLPAGAFASGLPIEFEQHMISDHIPNSVTIFATDIDLDGDNDVLGSDRQNNRLYLYINDGFESFEEAAIDTIDAYWISAGDIDQDGDIDIAVVGYAIYAYEGYWYENRGDLVFVRHYLDHYGVDPSNIQIADMDSDGDNDLVVNANGWSRAHILWYENYGNTNFGRHEILELYAPQNQGCAKSMPVDLDQDGDVDLVQICDSNPMFWLENNGSEVFSRHDISRTLGYSLSMQPVDMDRDGDLDLLASDWTDGVFWWENNGSQQFTEHRVSSNRLYIGSVIATDIDQDGDIDIVEAVNGWKLVSLWINQGDMVFQEQVVANNLGGVTAVFVIDLDQDGNQDIIVDEIYTGKLSWFQQKPVKPTIFSADVNIWNAIGGTGDGSAEDTYYAFEIFVDAKGDFSQWNTDQINLTVDGVSLSIIDSNVSYDGKKYRIRAGGPFEGKPRLGQYAVMLEDANGQVTNSFIIGNLEDYPKDAPHILFPIHEGSSVQTLPTFAWEPFQSDYLGQAVTPWAYELNLHFPDGSMYSVFPIDGNQTSLEYANQEWDPLQPPGLEPGMYGLAIHSDHRVAPHFNFEHHRWIEFEIIPPNRHPVANAGLDQSVFEGDKVTLDASASSDPDGNISSYEWDLNNDGQYDDGTNLTQSVQFQDDGVYSVGLKVTDNFGEFDIDTTEITVSNVEPTIATFTAPIEPIQIGTMIQTNATFTDPGTSDAHTATWDWGDNSTSAGIVNETNGSGSVSGNHMYTAAGVYTLKVTVTDDNGGSDETFFRYLVVYDSEGGFVTGGGWIMSPQGAYPLDGTLTGKASFGFISKYQKGASTPSGQTEFQFHIADMNFKSTSYEWLVIAGTKAQYKGVGTINGAGGYAFLLTAVDGAPDKFRIKIWNQASGAVVYDNQLGATDTADLTTIIQGGSIVIHKTK